MGSLQPPTQKPQIRCNEQRLLFVDQEGKRIHVYHPADGRRTSVPTQELTPAIILTQNPDVLVVPMEQNVYAIDLSKNGAVRSVLAMVPEEHGSNSREKLWRFNDARAAPGGHIIAGRMSQETWQDGIGGWVYTMQHMDGAPNPELSVLFEQGKPFGLPNGMCWNMAKREMYFADTYAGKVYVMPCDAAGTPDVKAEWRTLLTFDTHNEGAPDGMAIDTEGRLWVAHESGGQVGCYDTETGERLHTIKMPVKRPSAVAFGGADLRQLYITTISEEGEEASPDSGKLFVVDVQRAQGAGGAHKYVGPV